MGSVFVTGGSGFVGGRLIERLRAEGHAVRALARSDSSAERVRSLGAEPVPGELADRAALRAGAEGCELAFHAAATLGDWGSREEFERGNVQGTENVLRACAEAGVRRLVHVSTEAVLLAGRPLVQVDESAPLRLMLGARRGRPGSVYFVTDGEPVVFREFVSELLATQGVAAPTRSIPVWAARALVAVGEGAARVLPGNHPPPLTRFAFWVSSQECTIRIDKAVEELGYAPVRTIAEGLAELRDFSGSAEASL